MRRTIWTTGCGLVLLAGWAALADDWPQWRGPDRTGLSKETGLLKSWPAGGPKQLWSITTRGKGFAAPSVVGDTIYITGTAGSTGVLYALALDGKVKWERPYGPEWTKNYPMARTSPTIEGGVGYLCSGQGQVLCFDAGTGKPVWTVDALGQFRGRNIQWGIADSPLIVGDLCICHPGGPDAAVVALNKKTGQTVWTSKGLSDRSAYCSPIAVQVGSMQQILTQTENHIVGLNAKTGQVLWKVPQRNRWAVHPNTPVFFNNSVFISCGYGFGSQLLKLSPDGTAVQQVWKDRRLDNHHEAVLLIDGRIYGASSSGKFLCLNPADGSVLYQVPGLNKACITYADQRLYAYNEKGGTVCLVALAPAEAQVAGSFAITAGSGPHWAHPVVANGVLYIRHGEAFMAYDVKAQ